ncbi:NADP-dependent oxidoreductase [Nocardioides alkalitolerans]|uniref:NADP-dependent oxidoreductase n=1 Tax=Nocardioides alkalitolerans TaxID=281714 RepID=UPI001B7FAA94|nr:NADP-dependent oxidoreductase [Nocardioides alkalitolerans]
MTEVPDPEPGPGEVVLRVAARTVNPTDTMRRSGAAAWRVPPDGPYGVGMDASGTIEQVGAGVDLHVGDRVVALVLPSQDRGAYDELVAVPATQVARAPVSIDLVSSATLPMNGLTAILALDALALRPGAVLAVTGAAGAVGGYAIQLAKARGLRVVADASKADEELVRSFGADRIVPRGSSFAESVRDLEPDGVPGLLDGSVQGPEVLPAVSDGGTVAVLRPPDFEESRVDVRFVRVSTAVERPGLLDEIVGHAEAGRMTTRVACRLPLASAAEAHRLLERGGLRGRIVLVP